jgi:hypothetical protein
MIAACEPAQSAVSAPSPPSGHVCPECGERARKHHPRQIFCSTAHKRAREARTRRRGAMLYPFAVVARVTRGGTRGNRHDALGAAAQRDLDLLIQRWRDEDAAAGRMDELDYLALRRRLGFDRP